MWNPVKTIIHGHDSLKVRPTLRRIRACPHPWSVFFVLVWPFPWRYSLPRLFLSVEDIQKHPNTRDEHAFGNYTTSQSTVSATPSPLTVSAFRGSLRAWFCHDGLRVHVLLLPFWDSLGIGLYPWSPGQRSHSIWDPCQHGRSTGGCIQLEAKTRHSPEEYNRHIWTTEFQRRKGGGALLDSEGWRPWGTVSL